MKSFFLFDARRKGSENSNLLQSVDTKWLPKQTKFNVEMFISQENFSPAATRSLFADTKQISRQSKRWWLEFKLSCVWGVEKLSLRKWISHYDSFHVSKKFFLLLPLAGSNNSLHVWVFNQGEITFNFQAVFKLLIPWFFFSVRSFVRSYFRRCHRHWSRAEILQNIFFDLFMVERVIWNEKRKTFLHECMIRFQLESFSLVEFTRRKAAKDEKLREGKTLLYDKLLVSVESSRVETHKFHETARQINLPH